MLWNRNFILVNLGNFLMYNAFYMLLPILPLYLANHLHASESIIGTILSLYTIAALITRPVAGFWLDKASRKPLMMCFYLFYISMCLSYTLAATLGLFFIIRFVHGIAFGCSTVGINTMAVDIIPWERRGEGLGIYTSSTSLAMATGPLISLFMNENGIEFNTIFIAVFCVGLTGFLATANIKPGKDVQRSNRKFSISSLLLRKGLPVAAVMVLLTFGYGIITVYLSIYAKEEVGLTQGTGYYFTIFSAGLVAARLSSSMILRSGKYIMVFALGIISLIIGFFIVAFILNPTAFYSSAIFMGIGYGLISPTAQTMIINLGEDTERGAANATYLTFFDLGVGAGVFCGGIIAQYSNYSTAYAVGFALTILGLVYLLTLIRKHFYKYRLR
ncbi:MAG: MFS transporter [Bacteroidales bacterium]|nr:MFS transporter [Bacteroidales bacterium]MBE6246838.1 MFS transporter [Bacteroidales bacterium]